MRNPIIRATTATLLATLLSSATGCSGEATGTTEEETAELTGGEVPPLVPVFQMPTPFQFARSLDLECRPTQGIPPVPALVIRHLNPVLANLPPQQIVLQEMAQTCTPVTKNGVVPPDNVLALDRAVNLACYRALAPEVNVPLNLSHLNPVLSGLPNEQVVLKQVERFCTNVAVTTPPQMPERVHDVAKYVDFACFRLEQPTSDVEKPLLLDDLTRPELPDHHVKMRRAHQLCVPVAKNNEQIPEEARRMIAGLDLLDYRIEVNPDDVVPYNLLEHFMNPLFRERPPTPVWLNQPTRLLVPVAKNGVIPPND